MTRLEEAIRETLQRDDVSFAELDRYAQLLARIQAERQGRPVTLRLAEIADPHNPYIVAKALAVQGLAVLPVRGRQPLTDDGVYSATCDLDVLCRMNWRDADGCGGQGKAVGSQRPTALQP